MPVLGVGGIFFRARDPDTLGAWYRDHLGVGAGCAAPGVERSDQSADEWSWQIEGGPLVFAPFDAATDYWPAARQFMLNFRVNELDALVEQLRTDGIDVVEDAAWSSSNAGRFVRIDDPEGNPIELWEPPMRDATAD